MMFPFKINNKTGVGYFVTNRSLLGHGFKTIAMPEQSGLRYLAQGHFAMLTLGDQTTDPLIDQHINPLSNSHPFLLVFAHHFTNEPKKDIIARI